MQRPNDQTWRSCTAAGQAGGCNALYLGRVPSSVSIVRQNAERNSLRCQRCAASGSCGVTFRSELCCHLPGQHLDEPRPVHADGLSVVGGVIQRDKLTGLIYSATRHDAVVVIEGQMIEALSQDEDLRNAIAASTGHGSIVTTRT